ncbi:hypothetical protein [Arsukibacterium sp.]|uniref:hypothetical protein n=1 Tax=Arsukibacterium sp. TaxID=1977258 RepID=UPI002FD9D873
MNKPYQLDLIIRRVPVQAALTWLQQAWQLFKQAPLVWIQMFVTIALMGLLAQIHQLTMIAFFFLNYFLTAGFYQAVALKQQEQSINLATLFKPLSDTVCRAVLLRLAALHLLASMPGVLLLNELQAQIGNEAVSGVTVLLLVVYQLMIWMLFAYAVAIAYFLKQQRLLPILQASFTACWRNIQPLVLFALIAIALTLLSIPTMLLALLVVMPLLKIAFFMSFQQLFALQVSNERDDILEV